MVQKMDRRTDARFALKCFNTKSPNNGKCAQTLQLANAQFTPPIRRDATRRDQTVLWRRVAGRVNAALTRRGAARRARHTRPLHALERISDVDESFTHYTVSTLHYATLRYARYVRASSAHRLARPAMFGKCRTVQVYRFSRSVRRRLN